MHRIHGIIYCHSKWQKDIFIILISIFSIFRVEICLFANILESIHLSQFSTGDEKEVKTEAKTVATLLANGKQFFPENVSNCCPKRWKQTKMFAKLKSMLGTTTQHTHTYTPILAQSGPFINHFWHISDSFSSSSSRFVCCAVWPLGALHANCLPTQKTVQIFVVSGLVVVALDVVIAERCHAWLVIQKLMLSWSRKAEKICNDNLKQTLTCLAYTL